jgi:hypothetical protein
MWATGCFHKAAGARWFRSRAAGFGPSGSRQIAASRVQRRAQVTAGTEPERSVDEDNAGKLAGGSVRPLKGE